MQSIFLAFYLFSFSIFLASSGTFTVKNDNSHSFFSLFWLQILNLLALLQNKNTRVRPFPWKRSVLQNPDRERTNQRIGICLRLNLPYNNEDYIAPWSFLYGPRCAPSLVPQCSTNTPQYGPSPAQLVRA